MPTKAYLALRQDLSVSSSIETFHPGFDIRMCVDVSMSNDGGDVVTRKQMKTYSHSTVILGHLWQKHNVECIQTDNISIIRFMLEELMMARTYNEKTRSN